MSARGKPAKTPVVPAPLPGTAADRNFVRLRAFLAMLMSEKLPVRHVERLIEAAIEESDAGTYGTDHLDRLASELALKLQPPEGDPEMDAVNREIAKLGAVRGAFDTVFGTGGDDHEGAPP